MAKNIKSITSRLGFPLVFKSSFEAKRTSSKSFRGAGLTQGLKVGWNLGDDESVKGER